MDPTSNQFDHERFHLDLHTATWHGHLDVVQCLVDIDSIDERDETEFGEHNTLLHYASYQGHENIVAFLIKEGANMNTINSAGCTPFFFFLEVKEYYVSSLTVDRKILVDYFGRPRVKDSRGNIFHKT